MEIIIGKNVFDEISNRSNNKSVLRTCCNDNNDMKCDVYSYVTCMFVKIKMWERFWRKSRHLSV